MWQAYQVMDINQIKSDDLIIMKIKGTTSLRVDYGDFFYFTTNHDCMIAISSKK